MIHTQYTYKNIYNETGKFPVTHYYGKDVPDKFKKYINCEVETKQGKGIILGIEDHRGVLDVYFMIYYPETDQWGYELCIDAQFCREIEKENNL